MYNSDELLSMWVGTYLSLGFEMNYVYDSDNNLTEIHYEETGSGTYTHDTYFTYNNKGNLISYDDVDLSYNGNIITATGTIEGNANTTIILETNSSGLITKLVEEDNHTVFEYDSNGNLTVVKHYNGNNILRDTYNISYDQSKNPFYGQMKSIYIERFIEHFYPFEGVYVSSFERYSFPFFKNNVVSITENLNTTATYNYTYDSANYPIHVDGIYSGDPIVFDIGYY
ncbi:hypothetical protein JF259_03865 [Snuella sp. CAU 1569]|uniref:RHS repeat protein n=2 Tax=Snuella sedimenti TaxID=2798802 RepID=A0A8J7J0F4_9FLAO|nr:hypothetical protein [Snuella sedimenti]